MAVTKYTKALVAVLMIAAIITLQTSGQVKSDEPQKHKNLKVLPKNISHEDLIKIMKGFSMSLGVRCDKCHVQMTTTQGEKPEFDFASDAKPEKGIARQMIKMVNAINGKYLKKAGDGKFENISCVTCHRGNIKPLVSVDSLPKK